MLMRYLCLFDKIGQPSLSSIAVTDDGEKFSYMVLWGGAKALQLWRNAGISVKSVKNLQQVLKDYCVPSELKFWANRMEMRHITQKPNETFQDYTVRVMALADTCEWKDKDEQIICALIFGANHRDAQRKALSKPKDIKLKDVIDLLLVQCCFAIHVYMHFKRAL